MKIKDTFVRREVAGNNIVVAVGEASTGTNGMMKLNSTGNFLWEKLETGAEKEELVKALLNEYEVDENTAVLAVDSFVAELNRLGCLE